MVRRINKASIFHDDQGRKKFLERLGIARAVKRLDERVRHSGKSISDTTSTYVS